MRRRWNTLADLASLLERNGKAGKRASLTPDTALLLALKLRTADSKPERNDVALAICRNKEMQRCQTPCYECLGRANRIVRLYGQSIGRDGMERLTITLSDDLASAVKGLAKMRDTTPEAIAAEMIETALSALGVIDGDLTADRLTRFTPTDGEA